MTKLTIGVAVALLGFSGLAWGCEDRAMLDAAAAFPANASQKPVVMACQGSNCDGRPEQAGGHKEGCVKASRPSRDRDREAGEFRKTSAVARPAFSTLAVTQQSPQRAGFLLRCQPRLPSRDGQSRREGLPGRGHLGPVQRRNPTGLTYDKACSALRCETYHCDLVRSLDSLDDELRRGRLGQSRRIGKVESY